MESDPDHLYFQMIRFNAAEDNGTLLDPLMIVMHCTRAAMNSLFVRHVVAGKLSRTL